MISSIAVSKAKIFKPQEEKFDKTCIMCDGFYNLPKGYVKGLSPFRSMTFLPEKIKEKFICAECCTLLLGKLVDQSKNSFYKQFDWEGVEY